MVRESKSAGRSGFTLIEMLVVMGVMVVLATLALMFSPRFSEDTKVSKGADQLQGWLLIAKQRAYRDQVPRGIRLIRDANDPNVVREMVYIEQPEDVRLDQVVAGLTNVPLQVPVPFNALLSDVNAFSTVFLAGVDLQTGDLVLPGDFLQMNTYETQPYNVHRIASVQYPMTLPSPPNPPGPAGTLLTLAAADGTPSPITGRIDQGTTSSYQIVRAPRPLVGESVLQLPRGIIVDLGINPNTGASRSFLPGNSLDIIFSARGQVTGANANAGKIILWVRDGDPTRDPATSPTPGDQILIVVYTRTGLISAFPANNDPASLNDPFMFTRDAKSSGM